MTISRLESYDTYSDWLEAQQSMEAQENGDGDCPGCLDGLLDESWDYDKEGNRFACLVCPACGWSDQ